MILDAVARLILDEAGPLGGKVLVWDDQDGVLSRAALAAGCEVRVFCDDLRDAAALPPGVGLPSPADPFVREADVVLLRLPKSLGALEDACQWVAAGAGPNPGARVVAGGRVKHMTTSQNDVMGRYFGQARASRGRDKSRVLHAAAPLGTPPRWPRSREVAVPFAGRVGPRNEAGVETTPTTAGRAGPLPSVGRVGPRNEGRVETITVWSHGGVFNTNKLDAGTALLLGALQSVGRVARDHRWLSGPRGTSGRVETSPLGRALDLGCGSGILATWLALQGWDVTASDVSWAAVDSTRRTAAANGVRIEAAQRDGLAGIPDGSLDLIVTNPPFHRGAAKDSTPTLDAIAGAGAALAERGEFWCVFNSHLPYLRALADAVGPTRIVARDRNYTVTRSVRSSS